MSLLTAFAPRARKSTKEEQKEWPVDRNDYELLEECGRGGCSVVYRAICKPLGEAQVAIKVTNLEGTHGNFTAIAKEASLMRRFHHPNLLPLLTSFVSGSELWMVMPYLGAGSVRSIMRKNYPKGLPEVMIATICKEVLKGLEYMHKHGGIHRDVKAANVLMGEDGSCMLADFGVAAETQQNASSVNLAVNMAATMRNTFVGTPCWMAPEVMDPARSGYDSSADIWSFGITLLELATGAPPLARKHPMRVLLTTMQEDPPTLADVIADRQGEGAPVFSKAMHDIVAECLSKCACERPTATQLLQHKFFKQARDKEYLRRCFMAGEGHCSPRASGETGGSAAIGVPASSGRGSADSGGGSGAFLGFSTSPRHRDASPRGRTATPSPRDTAGAPPPNAAPAPLSIKAAASAALGHASTSGIAAIRVPPPPPLMMPGGSASGGGCEPMAARVVSSWHFDPVLVHEVRTAASTSLPSSPRSQQPRSPLGVTSHLGQCDAAAGEGATARSDCCTGAGISQDGSSSHAPRHRCHSDELSQALLGRLSPEGSSRSADGTGHDSGSGAVGGWGWLAERLKLGPKSLRGSGVGSAGSGAGGGGGSSDGASSGSAAAGSLRTSPRVVALVTAGRRSSGGAIPHVALSPRAAGSHGAAWAAEAGIHSSGGEQGLKLPRPDSPPGRSSAGESPASADRSDGAGFSPVKSLSPASAAALFGDMPGLLVARR